LHFAALQVLPPAKKYNYSLTLKIWQWTRRVPATQQAPAYWRSIGTEPFEGSDRAARRRTAAPSRARTDIFVWGGRLGWRLQKREVDGAV
jgi:hypothetical protein